jgi:hypothetical protein
MLSALAKHLSGEMFSPHQGSSKRNNYTIRRGVGMKSKLVGKWFEAIGIAAVFALLGVITIRPGALLHLCGLWQDVPVQQTAVNDAGLAWWDNIGGCGVSGASGGGGGGAAWVGRGVSGGLVNMDLMYGASLGGDYGYSSLSARFSHTIKNKNTVGISFPFSLKNGTYRYDNNDAPITQTVGGFGDMGFDYARKFGKTESGSISLGMGLPTGKYNHRRYDPKNSGIGEDHTSLVTPELQTGTGIYNGSLSMEYTIDKDWGPIIIGCSYAAPFLELADLIRGCAQNDVWTDEKNIRQDFQGTSFTTTYGDWTHMLEPDITEDSITGIVPPDSLAKHQQWANIIKIKQKYFTLEEKEIKGDFFGSSVGVRFAMGYKEESCVHSFQCGYSYKLVPEWYVRRIINDPAKPPVEIMDERVKKWYAIAVPRDRHSWNFSYGLEMSSLYFPIFMAGTMTVDGKRNASFSGTLGVKGTFF